MGMTMSGLNPNGFPQPQSIAPAPAMGIMAMMAAAAPQPAALSMGAAAQALPVVDTVPAGNSSLESGGGGGSGRQRKSSSPSVSLINIGGGPSVTTRGLPKAEDLTTSNSVMNASAAGVSSVPSAVLAGTVSSCKLSANDTLGIAGQQSQQCRRRSKTSINSTTNAPLLPSASGGGGHPTVYKHAYIVKFLDFGFRVFFQKFRRF